jgi:hypothetical protein
MFQATGLGQHDVLFDASTANILEALLYNFDFDDFYGHKFRPLKTDHSKFLAERVVPLLEGGSGNIWIQGSASRIGSAGWNMALSQVREGQVQAFLLDNGVSPNQIRVDAVGSTLTEHHALDIRGTEASYFGYTRNLSFIRPRKKYLIGRRSADISKLLSMATIRHAGQSTVGIYLGEKKYSRR